MSSEGNNNSPKSTRVLRSQSRSQKQNATSQNNEPNNKPEEKQNVPQRKRKRTGNDSLKEEAVASEDKIKIIKRTPSSSNVTNKSNSRIDKKNTQNLRAKQGVEGEIDFSNDSNEEQNKESLETEDLKESGKMEITKMTKEETTKENYSTFNLPQIPANGSENEWLEDLINLKSQLNSVASKIRVQRPSQIKNQTPWGILRSNQENFNIALHHSPFLIGSSTNCNLLLRENSQLKLQIFHKPNGQVLIQNSGPFHLNGNLISGNKTSSLKNGDELSIPSKRKQSFVFQKVSSKMTPESSGEHSFQVSPYMTRSAKKKGQTPLETSKEFSMEETSTIVDPSNLSAQNKELKKQFKEKFDKLWIHHDDIEFSFENFPYFLDEKTKRILINSAFLYLVKPDFLKYVSELPHSRRIFLVGSSGTEIYQETLVKSLAKHFKANLLVLDGSSFEVDCKNLGDIPGEDSEQRRESAKQFYFKTQKSNSSNSNLGFSFPLQRLVRGSNNKHGNKFFFSYDERPKMGSRSEKNHFFDHSEDSVFDNQESKSETNVPREEKIDRIAVEALFELLSENASEKQPCILFIKDVEETVIPNIERITAFKQYLNEIKDPIIVIGSSVSSELKKEKNTAGLLFSKASGNHTTLLDLSIFDHLARFEERKEISKTAKFLSKLFPNKISINPPTKSEQLSEWNKKIVKDTEQLKLIKNKRNLQKIMDRNQITCSNLDSPLLKNEVFTLENAEKIVGWAVSNFLINNEVNVDNDALEISKEALEEAINMLKSSETDSTDKSLRDIELDNEFERRLLSEVIPPSELEVKFENIGALDEVKQTLKELVMLPLQRPELFSKGNLTKPCKGILLFGPPGTGKTMLAKAVATQSGANFINISMSTIASKWFGEGEKYVKAVFTLASKIAPTVIFIDEIDSILGKRERPGEHEAMRKIKNEFMSNWDGLKTKSNERVLVLGATNRPFDLDDAVLRRLSRRLMVDLPSAENRIKILKVILEKEDLSEDFDYEELANTTEGFSGSDLKNLCVAAAYQPIREILDKEKQEKKNNEDSDEMGSLEENEKNLKQEEEEEEGEEEKKQVYIRPLTMQDFKKSLKEISASVSEDAFSINELRKWNEIYGERGNRRKETLSYFM